MSFSYNPFEKHRDQRIIFSKAGDERLKKLVEKSGKKPNWKSLALAMKTRSPRQCRERYRNYLNPNIEHSEWTKEEDQKILYHYSQFGNQWKKISEFLPGRTGNSIRNRYHSLVRQHQRIEQYKMKSIPQPQPQTQSYQSNELPPEQNIQLPQFMQQLFIPMDSIFFDQSSNTNVE